MGVCLNGGTQQLLAFLPKMTILGCFGGTTILGNTHIPQINHYSKLVVDVVDVPIWLINQLSPNKINGDVITSNIVFCSP